MNELILKINKLSAEKRRELIEMISNEPGRINNAFPLSFAQQRIWYYYELLPGDPVYNIPLVLQIKGVPDVTILNYAIGEIISRHESFRSSFFTLDGKPFQLIHKNVPLPIDERSIPKDYDRNDEEVQRYIREEISRPFDLLNGLPFRILLLRFNNNQCVLAMTIHHIIFDAWSAGVFFRELSSLYNYKVNAEAVFPLAPLEIRYTDYLRWQEKWFKTEIFKDQQVYWTNKLSGFRNVISFPAITADPFEEKGGKNSEGKSLAFTIPGQLLSPLRLLANERSVSLFTLLLASFKILLFKYTGQYDITVGTPIANRQKVELEELIGFFVNTLVLRTDLSGDPDFITLLERVHETMIDSYHNQDFPYNKLVEICRPYREGNHSSLFQVLFVFQNVPLPDIHFSGLSVDVLQYDTGTSKFDVTVTMIEENEGISGVVEYNSGLYNQEYIDQIINHYINILTDVTKDATKKISAINIYGSDVPALLGNCEDTTESYQLPLAHDLLVHQARTLGHKTAIYHKDGNLSYHDLNRFSNLLANILRDKGVAADAIVGVYMSRSREMIVSLYSILKAGGAYLPLDPEYPAERVSFMIEDSRTAIILTESKFADALPQCAATFLFVDELVRTEHPASCYSEPQCHVSLNDMAYVIYTSGSTGRPKGVVIEHSSLCNLLSWGRDYFHNKMEGFLASTSINFDASVFELFLPLTSGGSLYLADNILSLAAEQTDLSTIRTLSTVPSAITALVNSASIPQQAKTLLLFGEPFNIELLRKIINTSAIEEVINLYGPTECTVYVTAHTINAAEKKIYLGNPIKNTQIFLLDGDGQMVPAGAAGEIYIKGPSLGRGYLHRPAETQQSFVEKNIASLGKCKLYKTGDLGRLNQNGLLEYLGRNDFQVKIRGVRIETGEIQRVADSHPAIQQSIVIAINGKTGTQELVLFAKIIENSGIEPAGLTAFLKRYLSAVMIPSKIYFVPEFPMTENGKTDRKALHKMAIDFSLSTNVLVDKVPENSKEQRLYKIFCDVIGITAFDRRSSFFEAGGHSLLAVELLYKIQCEFNVKLPLSSLITDSTIAGILNLLEENPVAKRVIPLKKAQLNRIVHCIHPSGGDVFAYRELSGLLQYSVFGVVSKEKSRGMPEELSLKEMALEYTRFIKNNQAEGPYYILGWSFGGLLGALIAAEIERAGETVAFLGLIDVHSKINYNKYQASAGLSLLLAGIDENAINQIKSLPVSQLEALVTNAKNLPSSGEQLNYYYDWLRGNGYISQNINPASLLADYEIIERHISLMPQFEMPLINAPIFAWWASDSLIDGVPPHDWSALTSGNFRSSVLDGDHFSIMKGASMIKIANEMNEIPYNIKP